MTEAVHIKGQLQRKCKLLSYERAFKVLKNDICCITVISQAVLEIFYFKVDIPRKSPRIRISLNVSIKVENNRIHDVISDLVAIN